MAKHAVARLLTKLISLLPRSNLKFFLRGICHYYIPQMREDLYVESGEALAFVGFYRTEYADQLSRLHPSSEIVLVEADPRNFSRLAEGVATLPHRDRIRAVNVALWKYVGMVPFEVYDDPHLAEFHKISATTAEPHYEKSENIIEVPCTTFDNIFDMFPRIRHVFITINGAELEALQGMKKYLRTPGVSAWIKSPFRNASTGELMYKEVAQTLRAHGLRVFVATHTPGVTVNTMGKVFGYQPLRNGK